MLPTHNRMLLTSVAFCLLAAATFGQNNDSSQKPAEAKELEATPAKKRSGVDAYIAKQGKVVKSDLTKVGLLILLTPSEEHRLNAMNKWMSFHWQANPDAKASADKKRAAYAGVHQRLLQYIDLMKQGDYEMAARIVGIDRVAVAVCYDVHYMVIGESGPVLVTVSIFAKDKKTWIKNFRFTDDWDKIEQISDKIDIPATEVVPTIRPSSSKKT